MAPDPTYPPLNTLKPVADDVWIVDGPVIRFGPRWLAMPFPTRMTIVRLEGARLFVHSPTPLHGTLATDIARIGTPCWIIGPNRLHYWWIPDWHAAFPQAEVYLAPRIEEQAGARIALACLPLDPAGDCPWSAEIATLAVSGDYMTEFAFFHRASRTLILTDLIENFAADKLAWPMRILAWLGHARDPDGQMPRDMRLTFRRHKAHLQAAIATMIGWEPERIIIAHGRWYDRHGTAELRRAFRWLLPRPRR